jgi:5-amino-6-(5-phosphoribosylamino)uracil reductase
MPDRPYTLLSCGMSIDGYLGSATRRRLDLCNDADFDRVDVVGEIPVSSA